MVFEMKRAYADGTAALRFTPVSLLPPFRGKLVRSCAISIPSARRKGYKLIMATSNHPPIRAALYARVSTTDHGQDVGLQIDELRQVAAQRGWAAVEYIDDGVSTRKEARPAHDRAMADARAGKIDVVACWRFDRFARSTRELLATLEEFRILGVSFVSLRESVDTTTPMGKAMFTIIAAIAELERDIIQERVVAGVRRAQANGKHCGRPRKVTADKALIAAKGLLDQGWGWRSVSEATGVQKDTLRRRMKEAGMLEQNPPPGEAP